MYKQQLFSPFLFALILYGTACISASLEPVEIYPEDMCSRCRMAISDKRFAGEIVPEPGVARKFDDLGCLLAELKEVPSGNQAPAFAVDFGKREWINAKEAYYVRSERISTPMRSGLIAFKDRSDAVQAAARYGAGVLNYADVMKGVGR